VLRRWVSYSQGSKAADSCLDAIISFSCSTFPDSVDRHRQVSEFNSRSFTIQRVVPLSLPSLLYFRSPTFFLSFFDSHTVITCVSRVIPPVTATFSQVFRNNRKLIRHCITGLVLGIL